MKDKLFKSPMERAQDFDFGPNTAKVFDDMLGRSVPFYEEVQYMIVELVEKFSSKRPVIYDLGCSTGTTMAMIAEKLRDKKPLLIGIDYSEAMLEKTKEKLEKLNHMSKVKLIKDDLNEEMTFEKADTFIMNLTLQFVRPIFRDRLVENIYKSLKQAGCFIFIEKVLDEDSMLNRVFVELYYNFKKRKGYSELEIAQKREALENVLVPYRVNENIELLKRNGFNTVDIFFRWYNFAGFIGIKR